MESINRKRLFFALIVMASLFFFLYIFFSRIHPLVVFDTDDWYYIYYTRAPYPDASEWNPARVLPELLMPLCGSVAAFLVYPLTGDYIGSFTVVFAMVVSLFITGYVSMFLWMMKGLGKSNIELSSNDAHNDFLITCFFLSHILSSSGFTARITLTSFTRIMLPAISITLFLHC